MARTHKPASPLLLRGLDAAYRLAIAALLRVTVVLVDLSRSRAAAPTPTLGSQNAARASLTSRAPANRTPDWLERRVVGLHLAFGFGAGQIRQLVFRLHSVTLCRQTVRNILLRRTDLLPPPKRIRKPATRRRRAGLPSPPGNGPEEVGSKPLLAAAAGLLLRAADRVEKQRKRLPRKVRRWLRPLRGFRERLLEKLGRPPVTTSPRFRRRTPSEIELEVVRLHVQNPGLGTAALARLANAVLGTGLRRETVRGILHRRQDLIALLETERRKKPQRIVVDRPRQLWGIDLTLVYVLGVDRKSVV